jgi:hypothetical protein
MNSHRNRAIPKEPSYLRVETASAASQIGVDRENNVLRGYVVAQEGVFKSVGRGQFDAQSLSTIVSMINNKPRGLKSRFAHPTMSHDGLGRFLGRVHDARLDFAKQPDGRVVAAVRADLHFDKTALDTPPNGGKPLGTYVMDLAESDPDALSSSLALDFDSEYLKDDDGQNKTDEHGHELAPIWRPTRLWGSDIVDTGDAVDGLLSSEAPDATLWKATQLLDRMFAGQKREVIEARVNAWFQRYLNWRHPVTQAVLKDGSSDPDSELNIGYRWITDVTTACQICAPLQGMTRRASEPYADGSVPGAMHKNCKCGEEEIILEKKLSIAQVAELNKNKINKCVAAKMRKMAHEGRDPKDKQTKAIAFSYCRKKVYGKAKASYKFLEEATMPNDKKDEAVQPAAELASKSEVTELLKKLQGELDQTKAELQTTKTNAEILSTELATQRRENRNSAIIASIESMVANGELALANKDATIALALAIDGLGKLKVNDVETDAFEVLRHAVRLPEQLRAGELKVLAQKTRPDAEMPAGLTRSEQQDIYLRKVAKENNFDYETVDGQDKAYAYAVRQNPRLFARESSGGRK